MNRLPWLFVTVFSIVGLGLLSLAAIKASSTLAFRSEASRAVGSVVAIDRGKPVVEFRDASGRQIRIVGSVSSNPPAYEPGESASVLYRTDDPDHARIDGLLESWFVPLLTGSLGLVFAGLGGGFGAIKLRAQRLARVLRQSGLRIEAKLTGVLRDDSVRVGRQIPWRITAQWRDPTSGLVHVFESGLLFYDPTDYLRGETIEVWIDPRDPRRYSVDTSFLPAPASA